MMLFGPKNYAVSRGYNLGYIFGKSMGIPRAKVNRVVVRKGRASKISNGAVNTTANAIRTHA